jgi:Tol biopolymer transport system component
VSSDTNGVTDIFFHNRDNNKTKLVSVVLNGSANDLSQDADISGDGQYVVFQSFASNLVADDTNGEADIFRYDRWDKVMVRVSLDSNEHQANGKSSRPTISADGTRIAFESEADNLVSGDNGIYTDIFVRNMSNTTTKRVSVSDGESEAQGDSSEPFIAGGGMHVVFTSLANNLVSDDTNGFPDVFIRNISANNTKLISVASDGTQTNRWTDYLEPSITSDGRYISFNSRATNLVPGDLDDARDVFV